jgi:uncharacterized MAPEG superfamily protein
MSTPAIEIKLLGLAVLVGVVQLAWAAGAGRSQTGLKWGMGPRDEPRPLTAVAGRLERAYRNFLETFPLYAAAVLACYLSAKLSALTLWGSVLYVVGRALYVPLYAAGVPVVRSLVWGVATAGLLMVVAALFR